MIDIGYYYLVIGITFAIIGGLVWWKEEQKDKQVSPWVIIAIIAIMIGGFNIMFGLEQIVNTMKGNNKRNTGKLEDVKLWNWFFILCLIFLGSVSYTLAAYYHLKLTEWTFAKAFFIAVPLILIEYQFSIRGNFAAKNILGLNAVQITLLTMTFYFVNAWVLNYMFLKQKIVWWRESLAFMCIGAAFLLTTSKHQ